jgi:hypothetical protein
MHKREAAQQLKTNPLLPEILGALETDLIQRWRGSATQLEREEAWQALRQLDLLAGAIQDGIRKYSSE